LKKLVFLFALLLVGVASAAPSVVSTTENAATVQGLDCGSTYRIEIQEYAENGELSSTAGSVDAQTQNCTETQPPPDPPADPQPPADTQVLAAPGQTQASISVSRSASTGTVGVVRCVVPDVRRRTVTRARAMLSARRCGLGRITRAYSPEIRKGRILRQSRQPGARLPRGTRVNVAVSRSRRR
jgi:PASTA domain